MAAGTALWRNGVDPNTGPPGVFAVNTCLSENTDTLFDTDSHHHDVACRARLEQFFRTAGAFSYAIYGHTDSRASVEYNQGLSNGGHGRCMKSPCRLVRLWTASSALASFARSPRTIRCEHAVEPACRSRLLQVVIMTKLPYRQASCSRCLRPERMPYAQSGCGPPMATGRGVSPRPTIRVLIPIR